MNNINNNPANKRKEMRSTKNFLNIYLNIFFYNFYNWMQLTRKCFIIFAIVNVHYLMSEFLILHIEKKNIKNKIY